MVVPGAHVGHEGPERIKGRPAAPLVLELLIELHLREHDVSRPLNHHLHARFRGPAVEFAQGLQFRKLRLVAAVMHGPGTQTVAEGERHVVAAGNFENFVEMDVEEVLLLFRMHPRGKQAAPAGDDARKTTLRERHVVLQNPRMDRHVVDALLRLGFHDVAEMRPGEVFGLAGALERLVDRHRAHGNRGAPQERLAGFHNMRAGRKIHHRVRAAEERLAELLNFLVPVLRDRGRADVGVHLRGKGPADHHGFGFRVTEVERNDGFPRGDERPHVLGREALCLCRALIERLRLWVPEQLKFLFERLALQILAFGDKGHLGRNDARLRRFVLGRSARSRPRAPQGSARPVAFAEGPRHVGEMNRGLPAASKGCRRGRKINPPEGHGFARLRLPVDADSGEPPRKKTVAGGCVPLRDNSRNLLLEIRHSASP